MNTNITSREAILEACRRIVAERGMKALSMRLVADECHIVCVARAEAEPEEAESEAEETAAEEREVFIDEAPRVSLTDSLDMGDAAEKVRSLADELISESEDGDDV